MSSLMKIRRLWFLVSLVVVIIALLVPPAVSRTDKDDERDAKIVKAAAMCARKCHDLCTALPKSEDPDCDRRCDSISIFNGSVANPAALDPRMASTAVQEIEMCSTGCYVSCIPEGKSNADAATKCRNKCTDTFGFFAPAIAALSKTMAASGLAAPTKPRVPGKDDFKFGACSDVCSRKCATAKKQPQASCPGSCAEACGWYGAATTVLKDTMPPQALPSPAAVADDAVANTFKACREHCVPNDNKCATKCNFACYLVAKAKASMMLATGSFGVPV